MKHVLAPDARKIAATFGPAVGTQVGSLFAIEARADIYLAKSHKING